MQAAERSRGELAGGPAARAAAARWLLMSPETLEAALLHLNTLLREFALGGELPLARRRCARTIRQSACLANCCVPKSSPWKALWLGLLDKPTGQQGLFKAMPALRIPGRLSCTRRWRQHWRA